MKSTVIRFPGSNCERDAYTVMKGFGLQPTMVWHDDTRLPEGLDLIVIPGGFTYGDYLRCGAMAAHSPIMQEVKRFAEKGGFVLGVCNGFQILCETGLLPGTLMRNRDLKFICKPVRLKVENTRTLFTSDYEQGQVITIPIAHHDGCYYADDDTLHKLEENGQIVFRYCDDTGQYSLEANPNGSRQHIAGIVNEYSNVLGMMPHPERHTETALGGDDGHAMFTSLLFNLKQHGAPV